VAAFVVAQSRKRPRSVGRMVTGLRSLRSVSNARYMATQCAVSAMAARGAMDAEWATRRKRRVRHRRGEQVASQQWTIGTMTKTVVTPSPGFISIAVSDAQR
jgi:hypothetical protein